MATKHRTQLIADKKQVPEGFIRIKDIATNQHEKKFLSNLHLRGRVRAVKLMRQLGGKPGPVWVEAAVALPLLEQHRILRGDSPAPETTAAVAVESSVAAPADVVPTPSSAPFHGEIVSTLRAIDSLRAPAPVDHRPALERMCVALERIAEAAEEMWVRSEDAKTHHAVGY